MGKIIRNDTYKNSANQKNALLSVLASDKVTTMQDDWGTVSWLMNSGYAQYIYEVGDQFIDTWIDTADNNKKYTYPWHIADFRDVTLLNGQSTPGMIIQAHYAHPFDVQFSHERAFLKCPSGLGAGTYYFTIESSWGNNVSAGDAVSFTLTKEVPVGGCIAGCYGAPDLAKSSWRIYAYSNDRKTILETITPTFEATGTNLGTQKYDTRNGNLNSTQEMSYGWNRWSTSALRLYLNSDKSKGEWWTPLDEWDIAPDELSTKDGFLKGMPELLLSVIKPVKVVTYTNTVQDGGNADITYDKVFIPSLQEMYIQPLVEGEGESWKYWKLVANSSSPLALYGNYHLIITYAVENHNSAQHVYLRSNYIYKSCYAWFISSDGGVYDGIAMSYAVRFSPTCVIC